MLLLLLLLLLAGRLCRRGSRRHLLGPSALGLGSRCGRGGIRLGALARLLRGDARGLDGGGLLGLLLLLDLLLQLVGEVVVVVLCLIGGLLGRLELPFAFKD